MRAKTVNDDKSGNTRKQTSHRPLLTVLSPTQCIMASCIRSLFVCVILAMSVVQVCHGESTSARRGGSEQYTDTHSLQTSRILAKNTRFNPRTDKATSDSKDFDINIIGASGGGDKDEQSSSTSDCRVSPAASSIPITVPNDYCSANRVSLSSLSSEALHDLAVAYAPILFFHPLEQFTLAIVESTLQYPELGSIVWSDGYEQAVYNSLYAKSLLESTRKFPEGMQSDRYSLQRGLDADYTAGAGFDSETNHSKATIYYNAFERADGAGWVLNYHFYYTFHGYADLTIVDSHVRPGQSPNFGVKFEYTSKSSTSASSVNSPLHVTQVQVPPLDMHEGDWQSMRVWICPSSDIDSAPIAVSYQQHFWLQTTDCTQGECVFYDNRGAKASSSSSSSSILGDFHPVGFVALGTHATYPTTSYNHLIHQFPTNYVVDLQGIYAVDRTAYKDANGEYRMFAPKLSNVARLKEQYEIGFVESDTEAGDSNPTNISTTSFDAADYWQGFAGRWGSTEVSTSNIARPSCINADQTAYIDCPSSEENPVFHQVLSMMGIDMLQSASTSYAYNSYAFGATSHDISSGSYSLRMSGEAASVTILQDWVNSFYKLTSMSPRGPFTESFFSAWMLPSSPPIGNRIGAAANEDLEAQGDRPKEGKTLSPDASYCLTAFTSIQYDVLPSRVDTEYIENNVQGMIILGCLVTALHMVWFVFYFERQRGSRSTPILIGYAKNGRLQEPDWRYWWECHRPAMLYSLAYVWTCLSLSLFFSGYRGMNQVLKGHLGLDTQSTMHLIISLLALTIVIDTIFLVVIWIPTHDLYKRVQESYYQIVAEDRTTGLWKIKGDDEHPWSYLTFQVFRSLLLASTGFSAVLVVYGW
jgi:hypothetical protein